MSKISVIVSGQETDTPICECLASIAAQSYTDFEVLVLVASLNCKAVAAVIALDDKRFDVLVRGEVDWISAKNFAVSQAKGLYIAFMDNVECWPSSKLAHSLFETDALKAFSAHDGLGHCTVVFDSTGSKVGYLKSKQSDPAADKASVLFKAPEFLPKAARPYRSDSHIHK